MNYLVVVAHPDDEVLGAGATINKLINNGHNVSVAIMVENASARKGLSSTLADDEKKALEILGVNRVYHADFPNIKMNTVPHLELVKFVEKCIDDFGAEIIITHHPSDLNDDHRQTSIAVQAACRLFQRRENIKPLKGLFYMEVLSSTEWCLDVSVKNFVPNYFVEIGENGLKIKIESLSKYKGVMREYPHPRSKQTIEALSVLRGSQAGCNYAEAFECAFYKD